MEMLARAFATGVPPRRLAITAAAIRAMIIKSRTTTLHAAMVTAAAMAMMMLRTRASISRADGVLDGHRELECYHDGCGDESQANESGSSDDVDRRSRSWSVCGGGHVWSSHQRTAYNGLSDGDG
jgi:hypothetical protein